MYLWQRQASRSWAQQNEPRLRILAADTLVVIERPNYTRLRFEIASGKRVELQRIAKQFGGQIKKLPANWLKHSLRQKTKPVLVGNRRLQIPAGAAFGTGEHATTAMCLGLLKKISRHRKPGWSSADLGTGSGILALAAKCLGAKRAVGIDNDPLAISTARQNARLNRIGAVQFRIADVQKLRPPERTDVITANLFSALLIEILPQLKAVTWLILSGFLRNQEWEVRRALRRNKMAIVDVRRRGKWVAIMARSR